MAFRLFKRKNRIASAISRHFGAVTTDTLIAASRTFPVTSRVDLQTALDQLFGKCYQARLLGVHPEFSHGTLTIAHLATDGHYPILIGPLQHDEIDVGEALPSRCLKHFIKELMRRCAQYLLQSGRDGALALEQVEAALDEMLFSGGSLNVKLLGGAVEE